MTGEMKSSAIAFANTLQPAVSFACLVTSSESTRKLIESGAIEGISFPAERKKLHSGSKFKTSREDRVYKVEAVNRLRAAGMKLVEACEKCDIRHQTYHHWSDNLGIERAQRPLGM